MKTCPKFAKYLKENPTLFPCSFPPGISMRKEPLPEGGQSYVFNHEELGEIGRLVISGYENKSLFNFYVTGDEDDPMTEERKSILVPLSKDILEQMEKIYGKEKGPQPSFLLGQKKSFGRKVIETKVIDCAKCGSPIAMLIFAEAYTIDGLEDSRRIMYSKIKKLNVPTWVIGEGELLVEEDVVNALVLKVWPTKEVPRKILSSEFNLMLSHLEAKHCR